MIINTIAYTATVLLTGIALTIPEAGGIHAGESEGKDRANAVAPGNYRIDFSDRASLLEYADDVPYFKVTSRGGQISSGTCFLQEMQKGATRASIGLAGTIFDENSGLRLIICYSDAPIDDETAKGTCKHLGSGRFRIEGHVVTCLGPGA